MMTARKTRILMAVAVGGTLILTGLSACGKLGHLEQAPPVYGQAAKSSWSASQLPGGGSEATNSSSASKESERALPDPNGPNNSPLGKPGKGGLEGFGNATKY
jgi:hypothetical protein